MRGVTGKISLADLEKLMQLRSNIGEGYRQAVQVLLLVAPESLTLKEILIAIREKQRHEVRCSIVCSILSNGGFIQREQRRYATPRIPHCSKEALTLVESSGQEEQQLVLLNQEYTRTHIDFQFRIGVIR